MRHKLIMVFVLTGCLLFFTGFCLALIEWAGDCKACFYERNFGEVILETLAIGLYTYLAIRFAIRKKMFFSRLFSAFHFTR